MNTDIQRIAGAPHPLHIPTNSLRRAIERLGPGWQRGSITVAAPDGTEFRLTGAQSGPAGRIHLHRLRPLRRLFWGGDIGFAQGYFAGEWDTPDLSALLHVAALNMDGVNFLSGSPVARGLNRLRHWRNRNTPSGARRNIFAHYDLGNAFYARWLDESMTYSAALYDRPDMNLRDAQTRKYAALAERIGLTGDQHVLEIGCGWGGFAEFAGRTIGARVTAVTISQAQYDYASARIQRAGLGERVRVKLKDYRELQGWYDRVVSIEMLEAVGERYWPVYFRKLAELLAPGGIAGLQAITIDRAHFDAYRRTPDFIQTYIFPGGMLAPEDQLGAEAARAGLAWKSIQRFGPDYARTLNEWARAFNAVWHDIAAMGFDTRFRRLWTYYLAYCEAGFRTGRTDVIQLALEKI